MKKYLKTIEDIEDLRDTDTKIYSSGVDCYYQFIKGILCCVHSDGDVFYNSAICLDGSQYIEVPDELDTSLVGKLGWLSDESPDNKTTCGILKKYRKSEEYPYCAKNSACWRYFTPFTSEDIEKYTGYKVVKEE